MDFCSLLAESTSMGVSTSLAALTALLVPSSRYPAMSLPDGSPSLHTAVILSRCSRSSATTTGPCHFRVFLHSYGLGARLPHDEPQFPGSELVMAPNFQSKDPVTKPLYHPTPPPLRLNHILHVPTIIKNLLSVRRLTTDNNVSIEFDPTGFLVKDLVTKRPLLRCNSTGDLYPLTLSSRSPLKSPSVFAAITRDLWHFRLGHPGAYVFSRLNKSLSFPFCHKNSTSSVCESCVMGKHIKLPFQLSHTITVSPFDIIHSDVWTSPVASSSGHRYYVLFLDDYTNFLWTFPISHKSQVFSIFQKFHTWVKTQFHMNIKSLQCDNGKEYDNQLFRAFCSQHGIAFRFSCPYTSSQNGKSECKIRSINNIIRTLLCHSHVPTHFWHHALQHATYLHNILPNKTISYTTPTSRLYHRTPSYTHLRVFGSLCYPLIPSTTINKLQPRSHPCVFLGYPEHHRGYKCYDTHTHKITISRHVVFDEHSFPFKKSASPPPNYSVFDDDSPHPLTRFPPTPKTASTTTPSAPTPTTPPHPPLRFTYARRPKPTPNIPNPEPPIVPPPQPTRTMQTRSMTKQHQPHNLSVSTPLSPLPRSPTEALNNPDWKGAMLDEFHALIENKTWELVPRQPNMNIVRSMWIFKHKTKSDGSLERYKARLVCDGRSQQVGVDCGETFSPVVKPATIRTVLTIALSHDWPVHQLDVKNAFLHGNLHETVYMYQPMGFRDTQFPDHVCRLKKSLYGLKQAPRAWYQRFADFVHHLGFTHSRSDHSLFILRRGADTAYLLLYVDDILLVTSSHTLRHTLLKLLAAEFAMKDLGPLSYFLGIAVTRNQDGSLFLSQQKYAKEVLRRSGFENCKPIPTPVGSSSKVSKDDGKLLDNPTEFRQLAGALQYLTFTRPDISYAVQQVCMHMHAPRTTHLTALKRILRYISGTITHGLTLTRSATTSLLSYTDADWAGCPDTRRSTSGYCIFMGNNLLSWSSKRQTTISRSSAEAEYRAVANVVSETCWIRNLLCELHHTPHKATLVYCDNISAVYLSTNPVQHQRTKHIEIDIHFVREKVARGEVRVLHVPSRFQIADIFTKGLPRALFDEFRSSLNIRPPVVSTAGVY
ncbi:hypothetical protein L1887_01631 [Cichorium endivia]|nr:hypothetical protein L1887_01631 [Cichorium endivia]